MSDSVSPLRNEEAPSVNRSQRSSSNASRLRAASVSLLESNPPAGAWIAAGQAVAKAPSLGGIRRREYSLSGSTSKRSSGGTQQADEAAQESRASYTARRQSEPVIEEQADLQNKSDRVKTEAGGSDEPQPQEVSTTTIRNICWTNRIQRNRPTYNKSLILLPKRRKDFPIIDLRHSIHGDKLP
jgi:hypothetical protein